MRTVCLWCPDWPVVALRRSEGVSAGVPLVVLERGRVRASSAEARAAGVRRGSRKREAQARCSGAAVHEAGGGVEAREFEAVLRALEDLTPRVAVHRPGLVSFPARGPARYFGGDDAVARRALELLAGVEVSGGRVGMAGTGFAASLAVRRAEPVLVVPDEETTGFLAGHPVRVLADRDHDDAREWDELVGLLSRLGLHTLGDLAALPEAAVAARFGSAGVAAHRLARGAGEPPPATEGPPSELGVSEELDPPARRVDTATFAAKALADRLSELLTLRGLACTRVLVEAETDRGERLARRWRHEGSSTAGALAQRVRWQLEAWLTGRRPGSAELEPGAEPAGGLVLLRLVPEGLTPAGGRQLGFWGGDERAAGRAQRALARLQGMLGYEAVVAPALEGGRVPAERARWVPWGEPRASHGGKAPGGEAPGGKAPWPGSVPGPAPARVYDPPLDAELTDVSGHPVRVSGRGEVTSAPARLACAALPGFQPEGRSGGLGELGGVGGVGGVEVEAWAGPWVQDVRWWAPAERRRRALFQLVAGGVAVLVSIEGGRARLEALYD